MTDIIHTMGIYAIASIPIKQLHYTAKFCLSWQVFLAFGYNAFHTSHKKVHRVYYSSKLHSDGLSAQSKVSFHDKSYWYPSIFSKEQTPISNLLVCGDGDLSYSASVAHQLANLNISLTASVLESHEKHNKGETF